jgi:hypothetical protein
MGFFPSRAEPDIWMRSKGDHYEYIAVYVNNLLIVIKDPQTLINTLSTDHKFKLEGTASVKHLCGNVIRQGRLGHYASPSPLKVAQGQ